MLTVSLEAFRTGVSSYAVVMSATDPVRDQAMLMVLPPEEALRQARPLPDERDLMIGGLTDAEALAFEAALADR